MVKDFSNLRLKVAYDTGEDDVLWDFYIPVLSHANHYDRISGFFNSSALAISAKGMADFIVNKGKMRLITCPRLSPADVRMLEQSVTNLDLLLSDQFIIDYSEIEDQFMKDHVKAMGWLLANGRLEIRIAVLTNKGRICTEEEVERSGIMHQKVGILYDQAGYIISFSGSNNESLSGWTDNNIDEFKVFCSWNGGDGYIKTDIAKFDSFWNGTRRDVVLKKIPEAIKEKLIEESKDFEPSKISVKQYYRQYKRGVAPEKEALKLFFYQREAVDTWNNNHRSLLLQMATGTGKTRTAIGCMVCALHDTKKLVVVIACPQATLATQWKTDIENLDVPVKHILDIHETNSWKDILEKELRKVAIGRYQHLIIYATHDIVSSDDFIIRLCSFGHKINRMMIGDEVHGLGAPKMKKALLDDYIFRLGLSATPQRWFDDAGSRLIEEYFGNKSYEFSIQNALTEINPLTNKTFLVNYEYQPCFITLTDEELKEYKKITERIMKLGNVRQNNDIEEIVQMLRFRRADIIKNAENKYSELKKILNEIGPNIKNTIIFVSSEQIDRVIRILGDYKIRAQRFTQEQGTKASPRFNNMSERDYIINHFKNGLYQVLVAIKCLDEGIDIPSADTAIVMASSTNPREYIQRIGRVIRQGKNKGDAIIYDMIVQPDLSWMHDPDLLKIEKQIFSKEMDRVLDLSGYAKNNAKVLNEVLRVKKEVLSWQ